MKKRFLKKVISFVLSFNLLFQNFLPFIIVPAFADDSIPSAEIIAEVTPTPEITIAPEPVLEITPEVSPENTPTPTVEVAPEVILTPTLVIASDSAAIQEPEVIATPSSEPTPTEIQNNSPPAESANTPSVIPGNDPESINNSTFAVSESLSVISQLEQIVTPIQEPKLFTDKTDYFPTDTVYISGTNFLPQTTYTLVISSLDSPIFIYKPEVTSDSDGKISFSFTLDGNYRPNYSLSALDSTSKTIATMSFTDTDWPSCGFQCKANDVTVTGMRLIDSVTKQPVSSCNPGENVSVLVEATFVNNANSERKAVVVLGDLVSGSTNISLETNGIKGVCGGDEVASNATSTKEIAQFNWVCGDSVEIKNIVISWGTGNGTCSSFFAAPACSERTTKCYAGSSFNVSTPLVADFSATNVCQGESTSYTNTTSGGTAPYSHSWSFGDGSSSTSTNPTHTFSTSGTFSTTLTSGDSSSPQKNDFETKNVEVYAKPSVSFSNSTSSCPAMSVDFTNNSTGGSSYVWDFGDTTTSTAISPSHSYSIPGDYTVKLSATSSNVCSSSFEKTITVSPCKGILSIKKVLKNDNGGTKSISDFKFSVNGETSVSFEADGQNDISVDEGTFNIVEDTTPGYEIAYDKCKDLFVPAGGSATCTITNDDVAPKLTVTKIVTNDNGGAMEIADFPLFVSGVGVTSGVTNTFTVGTKNITESGNSGYRATYSESCPEGVISLALGDEKTCTITNDDKSSTLVVKKVVLGGNKTADDFSFSVNGTAPITFEADGQNDLTVNSGTYNIVETEDSDYITKYDNCDDLNIGNGDSATCTITNTRKTGNLIFDKIVSGGTAKDTDWVFSILGLDNLYTDGQSVSLNTGAYTVTESGAVLGYSLTAVGGACSNFDGLSATATVGTGDNTCTFTNTRDTGSVKVNKLVDLNGDGNYSKGNDLGFEWKLNEGEYQAMGTQLNDIPTTISGSVEYVISEKNVENYHLVGWSTNGSCAEPSLSTPIKVTVVKGQTSIITLCNARDTGSITIVKQADPKSDTSFKFEGSLGDFYLTDNGEVNQKKFEKVVTGIHSITEPSVQGWRLDRISCEGGEDINVNQRNAVLNLGANENITCTFYNSRLNSITAHKFADSNGSETQDELESSLSGWKMSLYNGLGCEGEVLSSGITDQEGNVSFADLYAGDYSIAEAEQEGWENTTPVCQNITLSKQRSETVNFGNIQLGTINVTKYNDLNGNGSQDENESSLSGWTINLSDDLSSVTGENGKTSFSNLTPNKDYTISEDMQDGWYQTNISCDIKSSEGNTKITAPGEAYGHHGACGGWNSCGDAATCAQWACEVKGYDHVVSYGDQRPCTQFGNCNLFNSRGSVQMNWGNWCPVMGVTDIVCSGSTTTSSSQVHLKAGDNTSCSIGNRQYGSLSGYKWEDKNGNHERDCEDSENGVCEPKLESWEIFIDKNGDKTLDEGEVSTKTNSDGNYQFTSLIPGDYSVCEVERSNWNRTYPVESNCQSVTVSSGSNNGYVNFGNQSVDPILEITKSNNATSNLIAGNSVEYRIKVSVSANNVKNITVTDLPPEGFKYRLGSFKVYKNGIDITPLVAEPVYHSPGVWEIGPGEDSDKFELVYLADIDSSQDPGTYKDLVWAKGDSYLASVPTTDSSFVNNTFAGTQVTIDKNLEKPVSVEVEKKIEGQVLGATTSLPATGANQYWLLLAAIMIGTGSYSLYYGIKKTHE